MAAAQAPPEPATPPPPPMPQILQNYTPITADRLLSCPTTGQKVERVLQPFTPRYKGTGFYSTDHRRAKSTEQSKGGHGR